MYHINLDKVTMNASVQRGQHITTAPPSSLPRTGGTAWRRSGGVPVSVRNSQNLRRYTRTRAALKAVADAVNTYATRFFR
eukprot:COSAG06_NODE_1727_length_8571_cov_31.340770_4_plen_80_part_00